MDSPRTGILILLLVAVFSLAGALLGWQFRQSVAASTPPNLPVGNVSGQATAVGLSENRGLNADGHRKTGDIPGSGFEKSN